MSAALPKRMSRPMSPPQRQKGSSMNRHGKPAHAAPTSRTESLILWRRIAGGCSAGQQRAIAEPLLSAVRTLYKKQMTGKGSDPTFSPHEGLEVLRLLGSLELLPGETKI